MPNCMEQVYSEEYYDFLIPYGVEAEVPSTPGCVQRIAEDYDIFFYEFSYKQIPEAYADYVFPHVNPDMTGGLICWEE